jgi:hypothetical protein
MMFWLSSSARESDLALLYSLLLLFSPWLLMNPSAALTRKSGSRTATTTAPRHLHWDVEAEVPCRLRKISGRSKGSPSLTICAHLGMSWGLQPWGINRESESPVHDQDGSSFTIRHTLGWYVTLPSDIFCYLVVDTRFTEYFCTTSDSLTILESHLMEQHSYLLTFLCTYGLDVQGMYTWD